VSMVTLDVLKKLIDERKFSLSQDEAELLKLLRDLPESDRLEAVQRVVKYNPPLSLRLASRVLQQKQSFLTLLKQGLKRSDASEMELWLKHVVPKLGFRPVVETLRNALGTDAQAVEKALYWLPRFLPQGDEKSQKAFLSLLTAAGISDSRACA
jgi:hypothetical protein